jgi:hypothetical protein
VLRVTDPLSEIRWQPCLNVTFPAEDIPGYAAMRVVGLVTEADGTKILAVGKPFAGNDGKLVINGPIPLLKNSRGGCNAEWHSKVLYDNTNTPGVGETWGSAIGSYKLRKDSQGYNVIGIVDAANSIMEVQRTPPATTPDLQVFGGEDFSAVHPGYNGTYDPDCTFLGHVAMVTGANALTTIALSANKLYCFPAVMGGPLRLFSLGFEVTAGTGAIQWFIFDPSPDNTCDPVFPLLVRAASYPRTITHIGAIQIPGADFEWFNGWSGAPYGDLKPTPVWICVTSNAPLTLRACDKNYCYPQLGAYVTIAGGSGLAGGAGTVKSDSGWHASSSSHTWALPSVPRGGLFGASAFAELPLGFSLDYTIGAVVPTVDAGAWPDLYLMFPFLQKGTSTIKSFPQLFPGFTGFAWFRDNVPVVTLGTRIAANCCTPSPSGSGSGGGSGGGVDLGGCLGIPQTLYATITAGGNCSCLNGVTVTLTWGGGVSWNGSVIGCGGQVITVSISYGGAWNITLACGTQGFGGGGASSSCAPFQASANFTTGNGLCCPGGGSASVAVTQ